MDPSLKQVSYFSSVPDDRLEALDKSIKWKCYKKGERVLNEGDPAEKIYFISTGRVKVVREFPDGKSAIMGIFGSGGTVAEIAVIDGKPYPASAVALEESKVGELSSSDFLKFIKNNPDTLVQLIIGLGARLRNFVENQSSLAVQSVEKRLARFLTNISEELGVETDDGILVTLPMTRQDLAEIIGTSFEVVERGLKKIREKKIIEVEGKRIIIKKPDDLEEIFQ